MRGLLLVVMLLLAQPRGATAECVEEATVLRTHLTREARAMRVWNTAWAIAFGAAAGTQVTLALTETKPFGTFDRAYEESMYVGATKATIGLAARIVLPLRAEVPGTTGDACADVTALRLALADAGRRERRSFWLTIFGGTAMNVVGGLLLWHRHDFATGGISFLTALPVGPISSLTQPRRSWREWGKRRASWTVAVGGQSLWIAGEF